MNKVTLKPWGRGENEGWEWDGQTLKPWGRGENEGWQWDGQTLKPWGRGDNEGWVWDGKVLKPWGRGDNEGWEWDGQTLKPWGRGENEGWQWDGQTLKPWGHGESEGWVCDGKVPIFVIGFICVYLKRHSSKKTHKKPQSTNVSKTQASKNPKNAEELGELLADKLFDVITSLVKRLMNLFKSN